MENDPINQHCATLLGLGSEWRVTKVELNVLGRRLDIFLEYATDAAICPVCGKLGSVYDQQPERVWRHLDTMQFETLIHAKTPRVRCADRGIQHTNQSPFLANGTGEATHILRSGNVPKRSGGQVPKARRGRPQGPAREPQPLEFLPLSVPSGF